MAGLFDRIAKQVRNSLEPKKSTQSRPKTMAHTANRQPVVVMPVKPVAPVVGPDKPIEHTVESDKSDFQSAGYDKSQQCQETQESQGKNKQDDTSVIITLESEMTTENIVVENVPQNTSMDKEDYLLAQIDEFRAKAQQLQSLLLKKESKVQELQEIVDEREVKARELELLLGERQRQADGITEEVTKQIDSLIDKVSEKMEAIGLSLGKELQEGQSANERTLEEIKDTLGELNVQQIEEIKGILGSLNAQQAEELKNALSELNNQLEVVKTDLTDKVHSENVQCYRNLADLLKSVDGKLDKANEIEKKVISVHKCTKAVIVLSVINMLGLVGIAALMIYQMLF